MSFITKRDRVFNEYDLFDLPARNEGKLKAYASCTDARAWSHFYSDKSEHLVDIIKRNNETCRPKYVPTDAIVNTLMAVKNAEIGRLKHKIEEFEQMLAAYDQLELTCEQKCEIANAHAAIKAANKELDEMCLDLDLSGYTEGIDSEAFETGKSRGDEGSIHTAHEVPKSKLNEWESESEPATVMETKANQTGPMEPRDACTSAHDSRIDDLQDVIITKDAKLSAMQNTLAVMENDICEPYCIYAHIYTALEKIFATLCQNTKYKEYLDLLTIGKDTRGIDVKGKILFKLKVLEKFSMALIAPCSQDYPDQTKQECSCYHAQVQATFALITPPTKANLDSKRALLAADIMGNNEIKEILSKDSMSTKMDDDPIEENFGDHSYSIEAENLHRLKNLQANYEDLLNCYENLKYERNCLQSKCKKYEELEKDFDSLKHRLQQYSLLWNEKEHYRKRSEDLDVLKEKFIVLSEETSNIETQLKAEAEVNKIKSQTIDELRSENIILEKKLNDMSISFEKEKNNLICKLKECECKIMCQEQQIKSLSMQIDQLLEHDRLPSNYDSTRALELTDEVESLKQQIKNLQNVLFCDEEEKHQLQVEYGNKLELINNLKMEIEEWKSKYEKAVQSQNYLQKYSKKYHDEMQMLKEENKNLSRDKEKKTNDMEQFICIINSKSQEIKILMDELEQKRNENRDLYYQLQRATERFDKNLSSLETEKQNALFSLQLARTDSQKLIGFELEDSHGHQYQLDSSNSEYDVEDNDRKNTTVDRNIGNSILLREIHQLRAENITNISKLQDENSMNKKSLELLKTESTELKHKLLHFESLSQQFLNLKESHDRLIAEKINLENELQQKATEVENLLKLRRQESDTLMDRLQKTKNLHDELTSNYQDVVTDRYSLLSDLTNNEAQLQSLSEKLDNMKVENERLRQESQRVYYLEQKLENLSKAYSHLQNSFDIKTKETDGLYDDLKNKIEENRELSNQIKKLRDTNMSSKNSLTALNMENSNMQTNFNALKKQTEELVDKLKHYENVENELANLRLAYDHIKMENDKLQKDVEIQIINYNMLEDKNKKLSDYSQGLLSYNEELEKNLIAARNELITHSAKPQDLIDIRKEVDNLKLEKNDNYEKIKKLLLNLDESEYVISNLKEELIARDDKIALLDNHINELQGEVRRLHNALSELTESSEQIKDYSLQNIKQSLKRMEAHHSRATHDMRSELAKLQNNNNILENQLSESKLNSEESIRDLQKYYSQVSCLQNERAAIVTDIKQLEIKTNGESILSPTNSNIEDILSSIRKITKCFESRQMKNTSLEKTLLKVQSSFQLVLDKADEEKKNIDGEKKKILDEKEAAVTELRNVELQYQELKQKYEEQALLDKRLISDLQAELLNQNLIIEKINKSKADYISKLEEDIQSLQKMYETSIATVHELQEKMHCQQTENKRNIDIIEEMNLTLTKKCKEINDLQITVKNLKNKSVDSISIQVEIPTNGYVAKSTQTNNKYWHENIVDERSELDSIVKEDSNNINNIFSNNSKNVMTEILPKNEQYSLNEVQVMRANIDVPASDDLNYKLKKLNFGPMEQCSIPSFDNIQDSSVEKSFSNEDEAISNVVTEDTYARDNNNEKSNTIDVYSIQQLYLKSPRNIDPNYEKRIKSKILGKLSSHSLSDVKKCENDVQTNFSEIKAALNVKKPKSEQDLFIIYNDSGKPITEQNKLLQIFNREQLQQSNSGKDSEISIQLNNIKKRSNTKKISQGKEIDVDSINVKPRLQIELPRFMSQSCSKNSTSDIDNKSLDSYTYAIYSLPKQTTYSDANKKNKQNSSNIPLQGSPNAFDNLSHDEKIYDIFLQNQEANSSKIESNTQSSNKINDSVSKLRVNSDFQDSMTHKSQLPRSASRHKLSRVGANVLLLEYSDDRSTNDTLSSNQVNDSQETLKSVNFGLQYILDTMKGENDPHDSTSYNHLKPFKVDSARKNSDKYNHIKDSETYKSYKSSKNLSDPPVTLSLNDEDGEENKHNQKSCNEFGVLVKIDSVEDYENKIHHLTKTLGNIERDYKKKLEAVKVQYDSNIKNIINEHNQGVKSIQSLHEETMQDVIKLHENEVENLRTMSIDALRRVERLEKENYTLKTKIHDHTSIDLDKEPVKIQTSEANTGRGHSRIETKTLTKTSIEAFNVKPKAKSHGPCTCSVDTNISDTIRNIFEQVDVEQRKVAENAYLKYIATKISNNNIEALDAQELSFLHLKVCRTWKTKLSKEEALQKRIDSLESELINKQRQAQQHMAELDRKVAEERRRLREVREAVCRSTPAGSRDGSPEPTVPPKAAAETKDHGRLKIKSCNCNAVDCNANVSGRRSAGDLGPGLSGVLKHKRTKAESNRAVMARLDTEDRRDRKFYDDPPIRLKRSHDRSRKK